MRGCLEVDPRTGVDLEAAAMGAGHAGEAADTAEYKSLSGVTGTMDLDQRLLGRPSKFDGKDGEWNDWVFTTRAYLDTVDEAKPSHSTRSRAQTENSSWPA